MGPAGIASAVVALLVLRALVGIVDTLPQFLGPYLKNMLSPLAIPSEWLRSGGGEHEYAIKVAADRLEETLATRVPARQLIPAASSCLVENASAKGMVAILSTLNASVKATSGPNLSAQRPHLLRAATFAFDFENTDADRQKVMDDATDLMLSLILKLSEVQLRQLYGKLRDWRGELDKSEPQTRVMRRLAFWNLSSRLGKELRSIFLPCLSTVFTDAVDELVSFPPGREYVYIASTLFAWKLTIIILSFCSAIGARLFTTEPKTQRLTKVGRWKETASCGHR